MATFFYSALDTAGAYVRGKVEAMSAARATVKLEREGFMVVNVRAERSQRFAKLEQLLSSVSRLDRIFFTSHLHTLLDAGIALDEALRVTAEQTTNERFRTIIYDLYGRVQRGEQLNSALKLHERYFSEFYVNLVRVGETSGKLSEVLAYLLEQQERDYELLVKARGAMIYPSIILVTLVAMVTLMMVFVIPKVASLLAEESVDLPLTTKILMWTSNFMVHYGLLMIPVFIALGWAFRWWTKTERGKWQWDGFVLRIPKLKTIIVEFNLARFARAMSSLLKSGIAVDKALELSATVTTNSRYRKTIRSGVVVVQKGIPLTEVLRGHERLYPPIVSRMLEVGERTGKLDHMLTRLAMFYEKSVMASLDNISSVIEPVLLLSIGLAVGFVAVSILSPIWKFAEAI